MSTLKENGPDQHFDLLLKTLIACLLIIPVTCPSITIVNQSLSIGANIDGITLLGHASKVLVLSGGILKAVPY